MWASSVTVSVRKHPIRSIALRRSTAQARFNTVLMTLLALTGLLLAALGIYSVIAWLVAQRTREIGVRMALGASPSRVIRQVVTHGLRPVTIGLAIGVLGALATGRLLQGQLFQVGPRDPTASSRIPRFSASGMNWPMKFDARPPAPWSKTKSGTGPPCTLLGT